jgi:hypothetical protein
MFNDQTVSRFFETVNKWEEEAVLQALKNVKISPDDLCNLDEIPRGVLFHILVNPVLCVDNSTFTPMILRHSGGTVKSISKQLTPGGLLVLALNKDEKLREWSQKQLAASEVDVSLPDFKSYYSSILETLLNYSGYSDPARLSSPFLTIAQDNSLWGSLAQVIRAFPAKLLREGLASQKVVNAFRRAIKWLEDTPECESAQRRNNYVNLIYLYC